MRYKVVRLFGVNRWQVIDVNTDDIEFTGNICECNAWIRLKEDGYLE